MNSTYHYVVLRLATDNLRGEVINVGIVLFAADAKPRTIMMATLNKLRALDSTWDSARLSAWATNIEAIVQSGDTATKIVRALGSFGFCDPDAVGMFTAESDAQVAQNIAGIKADYVANKSSAEKPQREKHTRLQTALRKQFEKMQVMGNNIGDIAQHLVVQNVPVPAYADLKSDFLYKNGDYRITQALDYHVAPDSLHNKLQEVCVKSTAAEMAFKAYGPKTLRLAVVDIPEAFTDATDAHIDLLLAQGFEVFHFGNPQSMAEYLSKSTPQAAIH